MILCILSLNIVDIYILLSPAYFIISCRTEGPGREILKRPSVCPSRLVFATELPCLLYVNIHVSTI